VSVFDPRIEKHLIVDHGEVVIDEVRKHWAAIVAAVLELFAGAIVLLLSFFVPPLVWWVPALVGGGVVLHAAWRILEQHTDRFVITNMRVFRVHGILSQSIATMPLARILDISVHTPIIGRIFGYGHFVFESAAQAQGLREIRFVGDPDARGLTIQRVIQQAGLRGRVDPQTQAPVVPPRPAPPLPAPGNRPERPEGDTDGWGWLADAQRREDEHLDRLRRGETSPAPASFDPDRTTTAPIDLPR
jgi:hypothetical protein